MMNSTSKRPTKNGQILKSAYKYFAFKVLVKRKFSCPTNMVFNDLLRKYGKFNLRKKSKIAHF